MSENKYTLEDFNFSLPEELIAEYPAEKRDESRLFLLDRKNNTYSHKKFNEIVNLLREGDHLVFNNARVINARIFFRRKTGGLVEIILIKRLSDKSWIVISNRTKKLTEGETIHSDKDEKISLMIKKRVGDFLEVESNIKLNDNSLKKIGEMPLPPYIKRNYENIDDERYQTVYATESGAAAAPTAGLHFTEELLNKIKIVGAKTLFLTLEVSWGTFQPVREDNIESHKMHIEKFKLPADIADSINNARESGNRVIAVGTTSLRVLESTFKDGMNISGEGETDIFIYPPYEIKSADALITNFHTPHSTLLMLVSAFAGYDVIMNAYREAVREKYRFFSYGDSMFII